MKHAKYQGDPEHAALAALREKLTQPSGEYIGKHDKFRRPSASEWPRVWMLARYFNAAYSEIIAWLDVEAVDGAPKSPSGRLSRHQLAMLLDHYYIEEEE